MQTNGIKMAPFVNRFLNLQALSQKIKDKEICFYKEKQVTNNSNYNNLMLLI